MQQILLPSEVLERVITISVRVEDIRTGKLVTVADLDVKNLSDLYVQLTRKFGEGRLLVVPSNDLILGIKLNYWAYPEFDLIYFINSSNKNKQVRRDTIDLDAVEKAITLNGEIPGFPCKKRKLDDFMDSTSESLLSRKQDFICRLCNERLSCHNTLEEHFKTVHDNNFKCNICNEELNSYELLDSHVQEHSISYHCDKCGLKIQGKHAFQKHLSESHSEDGDDAEDNANEGKYDNKTSDSMFICGSCHIDLPDQTELRKHFLAHGVDIDSVEFESGQQVVFIVKDEEEEGLKEESNEPVSPKADKNPVGSDPLAQ